MHVHDLMMFVDEISRKHSRHILSLNGQHQDSERERGDQLLLSLRALPGPIHAISRLYENDSLVVQHYIAAVPLPIALYCPILVLDFLGLIE
jgi:hypothetical protein